MKPWILLFCFWTFATLPSSAVDESDALSPEDIAFEQRDLRHYGESGIPTGVIQLGVSSRYYSPYVFLVDKKNRVLSIWSQGEKGLEKVAAYTADIGKNLGNKKFLGDKATPEGIYFMLEKYEKERLDYSQYGSRAFTLDYPNFFDRMEKKTGSGIWVHAVPDNVSLRRGSRGCVVVRDSIIKTLHPYFRSGVTPVVIQNEVQFLSAADHESKKAGLHQFLENWENAWEQKDLESYISFYHDSFESLGMDKAAWRRHKAGLNQQYQNIQVQLSRPVIYEHNNEAVVRFIQAYSSDQHQDFGEKTLYLRKINNAYRIVGETWRKDTSPLAMDELKSSPSVSQACVAPPCTSARN